ncbi:MAG: PAS domain-containing sensor histidine kinase [Bacteroidales bacterium]|nr:PAS domain-containing sensor histidine kinase [Bacteroidales bacterium]
MIHREEVVLTIITNKNLCIEEIKYINAQLLTFELHKGQSVPKLFQNDQLLDTIRSITQTHNEEKFIIQHRHERFWLKVASTENGYILELSIYNPFDAYKESNKLNYELLQFIDDSIIILNQLGQIVFVNNAFCRISQYSAEQLLGKMFYPIFINSQQIFTNIAQSTFEDTLICQNGCVIPVKISSHKIAITEQEHLSVCIIKDLSELKKAENEISLREQLLQSIFFASQQFLFSTNWNENIYSVLDHLGKATNALLIRLYENCIGFDNQLCMKLHAEWKNSIFKTVSSDNYSEISYFPFYENIFSELSKNQVYFVDNDEKNTYFLSIHHINSAILVPIFVRAQWWGFLMVATHLPLKRWNSMEIQALQQISAIIGAALFQQQMLKEQQILKEKAELSNDLKTAFLSNIGHELRTPLNAVIGFSELIKKNVSEHDKLHEYATYICENSYKLLKSIDFLVDYAKLESGNVTLNPQQINIFHFLNKMAVLTQSLIVKHKKKINVQLHCSHHLWEIYTDSKKLTQLFEHIIDNAVKFTQTGIIELGCIETTDGYEFYVMDTGTGIEPKYQHIILNTFRQIENETTRSKPGMGIGLSIANKLAHLLQGKLYFQSEYNKGTTFFIRLPKQLNEAVNQHTIAEEKSETDTVYVLDQDDEMYFKLYTILKQQYNSVKRIHQLQEIGTDAKCIIVNTNNQKSNLFNELNNIRQKLPHTKIITHHYKNTIQAMTNLSHFSSDDLYWNILKKINNSFKN